MKKPSICKKSIIITSAILMSFFLIAGVYGQTFTCKLVDDSSTSKCDNSGDFVVYTFHDRIDAGGSHVSLPKSKLDLLIPPESPYKEQVCCNAGAVTMDTDCNAAIKSTLFYLYKNTNSHIILPSKVTSPGLFKEVCISGGTGVVSTECNAVAARQDCGTGFVYMGSYYQDENSHVRWEDTGTTFGKICCKVGFDTAPPVISVVIGSNIEAGSTKYYNSQSQGSTEVKMTADDGNGVGIKKITYTVDSGAEQTIFYKEGAPYEGKIDITKKINEIITNFGSAVKKYTVTVKAVDGLDKISSFFFFIYFDNVPPIIVEPLLEEPTQHKDGSGYWTKNQVTYKGDAFDQDSGIYGVAYSIDAGDAKPAQPEYPNYKNPFTFSETLTDRGNAYNIYIITYDNALKYSDVVTRKVFIDTVKPVASINNFDYQATYPSNYKISVSCTDYISGSAGDQGSGCKELNYCTYDGTTPCTPSSILSFDSSGKAVADLGSCTTTCNRILRFQAIDKAGNTQDPVNSGTIKMDGTQPKCTITSPEGYYWTKNNMIEFSWEVTKPSGSTLTGVNLYTLSGSTQTKVNYESTATGGKFTGVEGTKYKFACRPVFNLIEGLSGNSKEITIDTTPPKVNLKALPDWTNKNFFSVGWEASDAASGIDYFEIKYNVSNSTTKQSIKEWTNWTVWIPGTKTSEFFGSSGSPIAVKDEMYIMFDIIAADKAGHKTSFSPTAKSIVNTTTDFTPATCSVVVPETSKMYQEDGKWKFNITLQGSDQGSGLDFFNLYVKTGSSAWDPIISGNSPQKIIPDKDNKFIFVYNGQDGMLYKFMCNATDKAGNQGLQSKEASTTALKSNINITSEEFTYSIGNGESIYLKIVAESKNNIEKMSLTYKGNNVIPYQTNNTTSTRWAMNWTVKPDQNGYVTFFVKDVNGESLEKNYTFIIGNTTGCTPGTTKACGSNINECKEGVQKCLSDGTWSTVCEGGVKPTSEICDGLDNDCDNYVDMEKEGTKMVPLSKSCDKYKGVCSGIETKCKDGKWSTCDYKSYSSYYEETETKCDGKDNDCDGATDEGCECEAGQQKACGPDTEEGICKKGTQTCGTDNTWGSCQGAVEKEDEDTEDTCSDNLDNDCDGDTDCDDEDCEYYCITSPPTTAEFPWIWLVVAGAAIMVVLGILYFYMRSQGKELTWEELSSKWSGN